MTQTHDTIGEQLSSPAVAQALQPPALSPSLEDAMRRMADAQTQLALALAGQSGDRERFISEERRDIEAQDRIRAACAKTAQQRTQEAADKRWSAGRGRYSVALLSSAVVNDPTSGRRVRQLIPDRAWPIVDVNADSVEEARERYRVICGITGYDASQSEVRAVPCGTVQTSVAPSQPAWLTEEDRREDAGARRLMAAGVVPA